MPENRIQNDIARQQLLNAFLNPIVQRESGGIVEDLTKRQMDELLKK